MGKYCCVVPYSSKSSSNRGTDRSFFESPARIAHLNLLFWERVMIPFIITFAITLIHGLVLAIDGDLNG